MKVLIIFTLLISSVYASKKAIYGLDNRFFLSQINIPLYQKYGESVAAILPIKNTIYNRSDNTYKIKSENFLPNRNQCPEVRFRELSTFSHCTGFLVGDKQLVTSAHCIKSEKQCRDMAFVFTHKRNQNYSSDIVDDSAVYFCRKIINRKRHRLSGNDFALIELGRKVIGRAPLKGRTSGVVDSNDEMFVIGHGSGLPLLIADNGIIRENSSAFHFNTTLDMFVGNSGSPVFNARTELVEGIISEGEEDLVFDKSRNCYVNRVCSETINDCQGERAVRITVIPELAPGMTPQGPIIDPDNPFAVF